MRFNGSIRGKDGEYHRGDGAMLVVPIASQRVGIFLQRFLSILTPMRGTCLCLVTWTVCGVREKTTSRVQFATEFVRL